MKAKVVDLITLIFFCSNQFDQLYYNDLVNHFATWLFCSHKFFWSLRSTSYSLYFMTLINSIPLIFCWSIWPSFHQVNCFDWLGCSFLINQNKSISSIYLIILIYQSILLINTITYINLISLINQVQISNSTQPNWT